MNTLSAVPKALTESYVIPIGQDGWCGPAALAYLLRTDPDTAAKMLAEEGRTSEPHCLPEWMFSALAKAGYGAALVMPKWVLRQDRRRPKTVNIPGIGPCTVYPPRGKRFTLAQWIKYAEPRPHEEFIVGVTRHWLVIHGDRYFDNVCREGKPVSECPALRMTVGDAHRVVRSSACEVAA